jgi:uncharacterized protein (TIGR00266 family)
MSMNFKIIGESMPCVEIELNANESIIAEAGAMKYFEGGINFEVKLGDGSNQKQGIFRKMLSAAKRVMTSESFFLTHFTNNTEIPKKVSFSGPYPGQIIAMNLGDMGGKVYAQKSAFICASIGTKLSMAFSRKIGVGFFGGEGFVLQKIEGDGEVFIHAGGTIVEKAIEDETIYLETGSLVAFTSGITYDIETTTSVKSVMFSGEGIYLCRLSGTGKVWVQTMPFSSFAGVMFDMLEPKIIKSINNAVNRVEKERTYSK